MQQQIHYLHAMRGKVIEMHPPFKAIVSFTYKDKQERALLKAEKLVIDGKHVAEQHMIYEYVGEGDVLMFDCHGFDETKADKCGWFITKAWKQEVIDTGPINYISGIINSSGKVTEVAHRHGIITYTDASGREHNVRFQASKYFNFGKRLNTKQKLENFLTLEETVQFDAIPCEPKENENNCEWFATMAWKGKKPQIDYDDENNLKELSLENHLAVIRHIALNPRSVFIRGKGQIMSILSEEFGIAMGPVKKNHWQTILFHRSSCFLFKLNLSTFNLMKIFKEGDRIRFIAAGAPNNFPTKWVASQISVYADDEFLEDVL